MFESDILEVTIGLALVFTLVSTICTAVREGLESILKTRASYLEYGIRQLLDDPHARTFARQVFDHPLISGLYIGKFRSAAQEQPAETATPPDRKLIAENRSLPSYIPAKNFAQALLDVLARGPVGDAAADASMQPITLARLRGNLAHIDNPHLQRAMLSALDSAEGDLNRMQASIEAWYDSAMDRVSGWYKRTTQTLLFIIALIVAVTLNVNTITIADYLFRHDAERAALIAGIETQATNLEQKLTYEQANDKLNSMHLPLGWTEGWGAPRTRALRYDIACKGKSADERKTCEEDAEIFAIWDDVVAPVVGWLLTALAAMLGAPFWFDLLGKVMTVRSSLKPRAEKKDDPTSTQLQREGSAVSTSASTMDAAAASDDHCAVGTDIAATPDDQLPVATGGVA